MKLLSSEEWSNSLDITVIDPDGWDRSNFNKSWSEKITKQEYLNRLRSSTVSLKDWEYLTTHYNTCGKDWRN